MTIPRGFKPGTQRLRDMVREFAPRLFGGMSPNEMRLAPHLRGNQPLYEALRTIISSRIEARARMPEPSEPLVAKSMIGRDRELQWLLSRLEFIYRSPISQPAEEDSEPPA